jgi:uncharacterized membrane protein
MSLVITIILAAILLKEKVTLGIFVGATLMSIGAIMVALAK